MNNVIIRTAAYDPWQVVAEFQKARFGDSAEYGATAVFSGTMRDFNEGDTVRAMTLEHYPGMTETQLQAIVDTARSRWDVIDCLIVHRVGAIKPAETIVVTAAWSAHRNAAFDACRYLIEELKHNAPFWKKEKLADDSERWVEENTAG
jgi:molybdopterin synthase catalytic subunit